jgi:hypothetical protein
MRVTYKKSILQTICLHVALKYLMSVVVYLGKER